MGRSSDGCHRQCRGDVRLGRTLRVLTAVSSGALRTSPFAERWQPGWVLALLVSACAEQPPAPALDTASGGVWSQAGSSSAPRGGSGGDGASANAPSIDAGTSGAVGGGAAGAASVAGAAGIAVTAVTAGQAG